MVKWVHYWLQEWGEWYEAHVLRSALGYPADVSFRSLVDDTPRKAVVPNVAMPRSVAVLTDIIETAEDKHQDLAVRVYVCGARKFSYRDMHVLHEVISACYLYGQRHGCFLPKKSYTSSNVRVVSINGSPQKRAFL
jgi:hypothetical protein